MKSTGIKLYINGSLLFGWFPPQLLLTLQHASINIDPDSCSRLNCNARIRSWNTTSALMLYRCILLKLLCFKCLQWLRLLNFSYNSIAYERYQLFSWNTLPTMVWTAWWSVIFSVGSVISETQTLVYCKFWSLQTPNISQTLHRFTYHLFGQTYRVTQAYHRHPIQRDNFWIFYKQRPKLK